MQEKIVEILKKIRPEIDFSTINNLIEDGILDSLDIILLVSELDATFSISIDGNEIIPENFRDVPAIQALVVSKIS